jgi:sensor histidine kinase YesM
MQAVELKISNLDWLYIVIIGAFFGFFISLFLYFLNDNLQQISTILFSVTTAICISLCASLLITISNNFILPSINERFWYLISFFFSFCSGAFGFLVSFAIFLSFDTHIVTLIQPFWFYITVTIGFLTFLVGLILHQFISMKYKNESIKNEILEMKIKTLENELNPHFLFNALNSMSELVYIDQKKAENSILNLSKFLRNAINKKSLIDIEEELQMVQTYVDIENIRFENKIKLIVVKNDNTQSVKVPKFSIQLLVENAIKHGYNSKNLEITVQVAKNDISVSNNGTRPSIVNFGTGLSNLSKRLDILNIGKLKHKIDDTKTTFIITLKGKQ